MDNFPEKSVILIEEGTGLVKSVYAQYIAAETAADGKDVSYLTPRPSDDIRSEMKLLKFYPQRDFILKRYTGQPRERSSIFSPSMVTGIW